MSDSQDNDQLIQKWSKAIPVPIRAGNRVDYLIDGWAAFQAMYKAILTTFSMDGNGAYYIYLLGWWLDDDVPLSPGASTIHELFEEASKKYKVQIRVMLWDQANIDSPPFLRKNNAEVKRVNALPTGAGIVDDNTLNFGSHHQKLLIVKGRRGLIGFCGGVDINKDRIQQVDKPKGSPMHDVHCRIEGNAAHDLVDVFVQRWLAHRDHNKLDLPPEEGGKGPLIGLSDRAQDSNAAPKGEQSVGIARTFNFVGNKQKCIRDHSTRTSMIAAIRTARRFIYIEDQYLWNFEAASELGRALSNIQHLTILIAHSDQVESFPNPKWARSHFMETLRLASKDWKVDEKKVRVFYRVKPGTKTMEYIHAKTWIFDDELAVIGSANCNRRGWEYDSEVIATIVDKLKAVKSPNFAQTLRMKLWKEHLGVEEINLRDGLASANYWPTSGSTPAPLCNVRWYDLSKEKDTKPHTWDTAIDPSTDKLRPCGEISTIAK